MNATKAPKSEKKSAAKKGKAPAARKRGAKAAKAPKPASPNRPTSNGAVQRLRPGELDGLVLGYMREHKAELPLSSGRIAKGINRSAGAVGNCLERLVKAEKARRANKAPREYDLEEVGSR